MNNVPEYELWETIDVDDGPGALRLIGWVLVLIVVVLLVSFVVRGGI